MSTPPLPLDDAELDNMLSLATAPHVPDGGPIRLMARLATAQASKQPEIIDIKSQLQSRVKVRQVMRHRHWPIPALLAASLAGGLVLGISLHNAEPFYSLNDTGLDDIALAGGVDNLVDGPDGDAS